jgi:glutamate dehydrogenase (NAD(P)+)
MKTAFQDVYEYAKRYAVNLRYGAYALALDRVAEAMRLRGWI